MTFVVFVLVEHIKEIKKWKVVETKQVSSLESLLLFKRILEKQRYRPKLS